MGKIAAITSRLALGDPRRIQAAGLRTLVACVCRQPGLEQLSRAPLRAVWSFLCAGTWRDQLMSLYHNPRTRGGKRMIPKAPARPRPPRSQHFTHAHTRPLIGRHLCVRECVGAACVRACMRAWVGACAHACGPVRECGVCCCGAREAVERSLAWHPSLFPSVQVDRILERHVGNERPVAVACGRGRPGACTHAAVPGMCAGSCCSR